MHECNFDESDGPEVLWGISLLKSILSNTLIAGFNFWENKGGDIGMFVSTVNIR